MKKWEKLRSETIFEHPRITLSEDTVRLPDGTDTPYLLIGFTDFVTVIAERDDGLLLVTDEYAYPYNEQLLQFPEGLINKGEQPTEAANRELGEETGHRASNIKEIGTALHNHRRSKAMQRIFLAKELKEVSKEGGDVEEGDIGLRWMTEDEIWKLIAEGKMIQKNALSAWAIYQAYKIRGT